MDLPSALISSPEAESCCVRWTAISLGTLLLAFATVAVRAQPPVPGEPIPVPTPPSDEPPDTRQRGETDDEWLDRTQQGVHDMVWRSAMHVDRWFGSSEPEGEYQKAWGS